MKHRAVFGAIIWVVALGSIGTMLSSAELDSRWGRLWRYASHSPQTVKLEVPRAESLVPGERVMSFQNGRLRLVGRVLDAGSASSGNNFAHIAMDPECAPVTSAAHFRVINARGDMSWALRQILPEHKLEKIKNELVKFKDQNKDRLMALGQIVAKDLVKESIDVLNVNLSSAVKKHEKEWRKVLDKHRESLKDDLLPVLKERLGPIVKKKLKPILTKIGKELWTELPVWSVTWRALIDKLPGVRQQYMETWWEDFLENKAIPIVKAHEKEFIELAEDLSIQAAEDEAVRNRFAVIARRLVDDPDFRNLVNKILNESLIEPFEGEKFLREMLNKKEFQDKFNELNLEFAPVLQRITQIIIEDEEKGGLNPDLVQVVRRVFFEKQARAVIVDLDTVGGSKIAPAAQVFFAELFVPPQKPLLKSKDAKESPFKIEKEPKKEEKERVPSPFTPPKQKGDF
jgi:hypothetical protein